MRWQAYVRVPSRSRCGRGPRRWIGPSARGGPALYSEVSPEPNGQLEPNGRSESEIIEPVAHSISEHCAREPSGPVRVSIVDENEYPRAVASQKMGEQFGDKMLENVKADAELDPILKDIITSSRSYVKYIPSIVEKLITRGYILGINMGR
ncbi:uncharacterized protein TNCV_1327931 [Trichonephila clavipes]|nr:uncharacterized protein TNCV_1327931 [Trichonephila clavipes]